MTILDHPVGAPPDPDPAVPPATPPAGTPADDATEPADLPLVPAPGEPRPGTRGGLLAVVVAGLGLTLLLAMVAVLTVGGGSKEPPAAGSTYGVVIPAGTGKRIASGFHLYLIPEDLQLHVGDALVVVNQDSQVHEVGPFFVRPGETMRHTFTEPGRFVGACTFHPAGEVAIEVFPPDVPIKAPYLPPQDYN
jgi:hypothetical protein